MGSAQFRAADGDFRITPALNPAIAVSSTSAASRSASSPGPSRSDNFIAATPTMPAVKMRIATAGFTVAGKTFACTQRSSSSITCCLVSRAKDRKSTRLNSSHLVISYAVFCLKKKKNIGHTHLQGDHLPPSSVTADLLRRIMSLFYLVPGADLLLFLFAIDLLRASGVKTLLRV